MPSLFHRVWPVALVALVALWLRVHDLARRPMHADEANQAVKLGELLQTGHYAFDAADHHGPTLYYAAVPIAWLRGQRTLAALDETTVRLVPAIAGTLGVILLALLAAPLGRWPAVLAATLMAVSPPAVYYSRYFVQETLLVTLLLAALLCTQRWWRSGRATWAIGAGIFGGLMLATKESAMIFALAGVVAAIIARVRPPAANGLARGGLFATGVALAVAALFYSSFGQHLAGIGDALDAMGNGLTRATGMSGHEKPWWYYLQLYTWQRRGGLAWEQLAFTTLAVIGGILALYRPQKLLRWAAAYFVVIAVVFSLTPYKTPWHAVHFVPPMALLAAGLVGALGSVRLAVLPVALVIGCIGFQTNRVAFAYPADARNPYAYVHSSPDVLKFRGLAEAAIALAPDQPVRVISDEYWPLPWYLRGLSQVGYWSTTPEDCDGALVIVGMNHVQTVRTRLRGKYQERYLGLRPGVLCVVFTPLP